MEDKRQISQEEVIQMENELSKMEYELNEQYQEIGKIFLERAEQESKKVNSLVDQIVKIKQRLASTKEKKRCPECAEHNDLNSIYCKRCGMKLPEVFEIKEDHHGRSYEKRYGQWSRQRSKPNEPQ